MSFAVTAGRRLAWWQDALAIAAIFVATALRFYPAVTSPQPLGDELAQEKAYLQEAAGKSPYIDGSYVYPPSLLRVGEVLRQLPLVSPFLPLRCLSLAGLAFLLWFATGWLHLRIWPRLGLALLYAALAPGVMQGVEFGNLSFAVGGILLLGLLVWPRMALGSGLLLGASLLVKPLAPAALVALFFHRPAGGGRPRLAVVIAAIAAALPLLADPEIGAFLRHGSHAWVVGRSVSVHRFLALAGIPEAASVLMLLLLGAVALVAWRWVTTVPQLLAVALAACVTVTPVVWNHTLVLTLPLQTMAVAIAAGRYRAAPPGAQRERAWEVAGIALAVLSLTFAEGATGIDDRSVALQLFAVLPPALAPALLAAYVLRLDSPAAHLPASKTG